MSREIKFWTVWLPSVAQRAWPIYESRDKALDAAELECQRKRGPAYVLIAESGCRLESDGSLFWTRL